MGCDATFQMKWLPKVVVARSRSPWRELAIDFLKVEVSMEA
jgi:hypothetical protein